MGTFRAAGFDERMTDCQTISVKHGIKNGFPCFLMGKKMPQSFILIEKNVFCDAGAN